MNRLTTDGRKIHARESITLNGMTKDELRQHYIEIFDRLQEYEAEEECGQLVRLPCGVGDTVYAILDTLSFPKGVYECEIARFIITRHGIAAALKVKKGSVTYANIPVYEGDIFLTREAAEAKLKD